MYLVLLKRLDPPRLKVWDSRPEHDSVSRQNPCPAQKQKRRQTFCALPQLGVNNPKPTDKTIVAQPDLRCKSASLTQTKSLGLRLAKAVHADRSTHNGFHTQILIPPIVRLYNALCFPTDWPCTCGSIYVLVRDCVFSIRTQQSKLYHG